MKAKFKPIYDPFIYLDDTFYDEDSRASLFFLYNKGE